MKIRVTILFCGKMDKQSLNESILSSINVTMYERNIYTKHISKPEKYHHFFGVQLSKRNYIVVCSYF